MPDAIRLHDERAAFRAVEVLIWRDGPVCPHCGERSRLGRLSGPSSSIGTWKCYHCRKPFSVKHGTIFHNSHIPLHVWLQGLYLLMSSGQRLSLQKLGRILGISIRTACHLKGKIAAGLAAEEGHADTPPPEAWPYFEIRVPLPECSSPPKPGQAIYRARYERFLAALDNLAAPCSDAVFFQALRRLLSQSSRTVPPHFASTVEQQLELSLFDDLQQQIGCWRQDEAKLW
ncbi:transposase [Bosea sp. BIWAKO-01]|uniref:transposase n=1 Tax=Bosea sp. BIWAKO-01 TaxID=506668 RepID=UPI000943152B|nr:transposase [Bosea sp. BIWAKO-01]